MWKSIANDVAVHKRYKKRRGVTVSDRDAYSHLRSITLAKHKPPPAVARTVVCSSPRTAEPSLDAPSVAPPLIVAVCRRQPAAVVTHADCCWMACVAAEMVVHVRKEKLRKELCYETVVAPSFVPLCPTCRQVLASLFVPFVN